MNRMERKTRTLKYRGSIVDVYEDCMEAPDGATEQWDYVAHRMGAAAVLPVLPDGRLILVRQYREAVELEMPEIPAGARDSLEETSMQCAARELEEETGYRSNHLTHLVSICTTPAFCNEKIEIFLADGLRKSRQHLDSHEYLAVEYYSPQEAADLVLQGKIQDAKTVAAILAYRLLQS